MGVNSKKISVSRQGKVAKSYRLYAISYFSKKNMRR
jgi:hypothetical protein